MQTWVLVTAVLTSIAAPSWAQDSRAVPLFAPAIGGVETLAMPSKVLRQRFVGIDLAGIEETRAQAASLTGGAVRLNLFDDAVFEAVITGTEPTSAGYWLTGHLVDNQLASVTLVVNGEVVAGSVRAPGGAYAIRTVGDGLYAVRQLDPTAFLTPESDALVPPIAPQPEPAREEPIRPSVPSVGQRPTAARPDENGSRIDILVVFTPQAKAADGGLHALWAHIDLAIAETNHAYADSGVLHRLHLAHAVEVRYTERGRNLGTVLDHLTNPSDGYMDEVHRWRDRYAADIVYLVANGLGGGVAWIAVDLTGGTRRGIPGKAFSLGDLYVLSQETGHNMGLHHDRYHTRYAERVPSTQCSTPTASAT